MTRHPISPTGPPIASSTTRVLVAEDSLTVRKALVEALSGDPDIEVVGEAEDGKRAIELCLALRPDVVTLDMMLPVMSGLAATEYIMAYCPTPILIVSASTNRGELFKTYDALAAGAVDVMDKSPDGSTHPDWERKLVSTVKLVSRIPVVTHPRAKLEALRPGSGSRRAFPSRDRAFECIAIGASTGGPAAVLRILRALPSGFSVPVLVVVHIGPTFATSLAEWLDGQAPHRVAFAKDGQRWPPPDGPRIVIAPPDRHLELFRGRVRLTADPERFSCRPSVDVLFESVAREVGAAAVACLLTGMGKDGAAGLLAVRRAGGVTIAQDEGSSLVFGMPREGIALGAAEHVASLGDIGALLIGLTGEPPKKGPR
jgi:two-component system chemotaxis response regulator CheB